MAHENFKKDLEDELKREVLTPYNKGLKEENEVDGKSKTTGTIPIGTISFKDKDGQLPDIDLGILGNAIRGTRLDSIAKQIIAKHIRIYKA